MKRGALRGRHVAQAALEYDVDIERGVVVMQAREAVAAQFGNVFGRRLGGVAFQKTARRA